MSARRRRTGQESDEIAVIVTSESYDRHEGKLKNYNRSASPVRTLPDNSCSPTIEVMAARDRTKEFSNAIQNLQSRQTTKAINIRDPKKSVYVQSHAQFMVIARAIGKNIASTYSKLEKLTLLAKRKSLFQDRSTEIQELTYIIKDDLNSLNQQISELQEIAKSQKRKHENGKQHLVSHSSSVLLALQSKLATMSTEFKQVLEVRTQNLKQQKTRRDHFSDSNLPASMSPSSINNSRQGSLLLQEGQVHIDLDNQNSAGIPLLQSQGQMNYDQTNSYFQSRAETMQNIESTIVELGGIYQQLAHMVKEQEEMVDRIDSNLDSAHLNVEAAHSEILKYFQSVTSNRWLMIKELEHILLIVPSM
ncbi:Syntaxin-5 [Polyplax serrata]|uniref:Syntaxin-5 n=1 Tax=Polyplax serrata TaxID=468196 RepID=A0AAN8NZA9_POLSC